MNNYMIKYFFMLLIIPGFSSGESIRVIPGAAPVKISATTQLVLNNFVAIGPYSASSAPVANITGFIYGSASFGAGIQCTKMANWKCIDGYCGIPVNATNTDVLYLPSGSVYAKFRTTSTGPVVDGSVAFNTNSPAFTQAQQYSSYACFPQSPNNQSYHIGSGTNNTTDFNANLEWYIYAPASAQGRKISVGGIGITGVFGQTGGSRVAIPANDIEVGGISKCTVSSPPTIDFGSINRNDSTDNLLGIQNGNLTINCEGTSQIQRTDVKISFLGNTEYVRKAMRLKNSSGDILANVMGRLVSPLSGVCSSDYTTNDVTFDGVVSLTLLDVGPGKTEVPLTWSLCKYDNTTKTGEGTAQATVTIDWG